MKIHYTNSNKTSKNKGKNLSKKQIVNQQKISLL